jgi:hypothetical protein
MPRSIDEEKELNNYIKLAQAELDSMKWRKVEDELPETELSDWYLTKLDKLYQPMVKIYDPYRKKFIGKQPRYWTQIPKE